MDIAAVLQGLGRAAPDELPQVLRTSLHGDGVEHVRLYVVDYELAGLRPVLTGAIDPGVPLDIATSVAGRCFATQEAVEDPLDSRRVWVAVRERADRLGVLQLTFKEHPDRSRIEESVRLGLLVGQLLRTSGRYTDVFEQQRRRTEMNLASEMQWELLPSLSFAMDGVEVHGLLEPAYEIGGDAFDYASNGPVLSVAIFDAMGHGLEASQASSLVLSAYRYARRRRLHLVDTVMTIDVALAHLYSGDRFATGQLFQLDRMTGRVEWVNAGHPAPMLVRGNQVVEDLDVAPTTPFGLGAQVTEVGQLQLEPGEGILLFSDGASEARPEGGDQLGREGLRQLVNDELPSGRQQAEVLRRLVRGVQSHRAAELEDDVTFVLVRYGT